MHRVVCEVGRAANEKAGNIQIQVKGKEGVSPDILTFTYQVSKKKYVFIAIDGAVTVLLKRSAKGNLFEGKLVVKRNLYVDLFLFFLPGCCGLVALLLCHQL